MENAQRTAGIAGVLAGVGLAAEAALWTASGWTPQTWADPGTALAFLRDHGTMLQAAVFTGAINLLFTVVLIAGLAARLRAATPTLSASTLHFGVIGVAVHSLVPLSLWLGTPMFVSLASANAGTAAGGWAGFAVFLAGAGGAGSLFLGMSMLAAGGSGLSAAAPLPRWLGVLGILAGALSVVSVLAATTVFNGLAEAAYMPSLLLAIAFRTAAGVHLFRHQEIPARPAARVLAD